MKRVICPVCKGRRKVGKMMGKAESKPCERCGGEGYVESDAVLEEGAPRPAEASVIPPRDPWTLIVRQMGVD